MTYRRQDSQSGRVSDMLHTLRGEQFRHSQNVNGSTSLSLLNAKSTPTGRYLNLDYSTETSITSAVQGQPNLPRNRQPYSGPPPPKSWRVNLAPGEDDRFSAAWRAEALSLVFQSRPSSQTFTLEPNIIPSLTQLCLGKLLSECTTQEFYDLVPCLPVHLRLELVRYAAIHCPLSSSKLRALLGTDGHADGELLVIGPSASSVRFRQTRATVSALQGESVDWDMEDSTPNPLQSLIIVSNRLAMSTVLTFPPTITHLALINLENPIPLHQLPALCPLLLFLDLSYNLWLTNMSIDTLKSIERVDWSRWSQLKTLGWRECFIPDGMLNNLNKRRWDDVEVVY